MQDHVAVHADGRIDEGGLAVPEFQDDAMECALDRTLRRLAAASRENDNHIARWGACL